MGIYHYPITQAFIPGLEQTPYRNGKGMYEGVVCHATCSNDGIGLEDIPSNERNFEMNDYPNSGIFVHFFVGHEKDGRVVILQTAPVEYIARHCGGANRVFASVELCMYQDPKLFSEAYDAYVYIIAKLLFDRRLGVSKATVDGSGTCYSHDDVRRIYGKTTHDDPLEYLASHGISWSQHIANVEKYYNMLVAETQPQPDPQPAQPPVEQWEIQVVQKALSVGILHSNHNPHEQTTVAFALATLMNGLKLPIENVNPDWRVNVIQAATKCGIVQSQHSIDELANKAFILATILNALKIQIPQVSPDWKVNVMSAAHSNGIIQNNHNPDEIAFISFTLAVIMNALRIA